MRIMISAGGTGGGVYPAFAAARALLDGEQFPGVELVFVGGLGAGGMEPEMITRSGIPWVAAAYIHGGPLHGVSLPRMITSAVKLVRGLGEALMLVGQHRPDAVFVTGGWASLPVALAAWLRRVPVYGYVPDIEPGLTLRVVSRFARKIAATVADSAEYFRPGQVVVTGYPLRPDMLTATRAAAIDYFGLDPDHKTLLITGGSSGARTINNAVLAILPDLLADEGLQILHLTGKLDWPTVEAARAELPPATQARYHAYDYLHDAMGLALAGADLVVSRAGASTLGELPQFGLPAVLVPYPFAWRYQKVNADYLVSRGAAIRLDDERMVEALYPTIRSLFDEPERLAALAEQARALAQPEGALNIARLIMGRSE